MTTVLDFDRLPVGEWFPPLALALSAAQAQRVARLFGLPDPAEGGTVPAMLLSHFAHVRQTLPGEVPDGTVILGSDYDFLRPVRVGDTITFTTKVVEKTRAAGKQRVTLACEVRDGSGQLAARLTHRLRWGAA